MGGMTTPPKSRRPPARAWMGLGLWLAAAGLSLAGVGWARAWFYQMAWWGYILLADGLLPLAGRRPLLRGQGAANLLWLAGASTVFWIFYELLNLAALGNWHYQGVERVLWLRWLGGLVAFATVLPGVLLTHELLRAWGLGWGVRARPLAAGRAWYPWFRAAGLLMLALPLAWPRLFFPLVWGALVFLLEPFNHRRGAPSLMADWQRGDLSRFWGLLVAGLVCGLLWESWNFLAGARWAYTLPWDWLNHPKLFAMPVWGYLGFPPFAVECFVAASALGPLKAWAGRGRGRALALATSALVFDLLVLYLMDQHLPMTHAD